MKSVMIVGGLDGAVKELYDSLAPFCHPQICTGGEAAIQGMMELLRPDVVAILLEHTDTDPGDIFFLLEKHPHRPPVVAVGPVELQSRLIRDRWLPNKRIVYLQSPVTAGETAECVRDSLPEEERVGRPERKDDGRKRVLVVDDDPFMLQVLDRMLSDRWNVVTAASGLRAIEEILASRPDAILLDYDMPVLDGRMMLRLLREEESTRDIPVVFLTGMSEPAYVEQLLALKPQGYLLKPPSREKIVQKLESLLGGGRAGA